MGGRVRCTRKLKQWMIEQVDSEKYPGLVWDDRKLGMFRIPWKHAGKQDYRHDEDAAIFKAWAKFKGKFNDGDKVDPATWKTRLRCALNKSCEFEEVPQRSQLDISEPYKVYKIVDDNTIKRKSAADLDLGTVKVKRAETTKQVKSEPSSLTLKKEWANVNGKFMNGGTGKSAADLDLGTVKLERAEMAKQGSLTQEEVECDSPALVSQQAEESDSSSDPSSGSEMSVQEEGSGESTLLEWVVIPTTTTTEVVNNYTNSVTNLMSPSQLETEPNSMFISFHYGGVEVGHMVTRHGCKISSAPPPSRSDASFGSQAMEKLRFPPADGVSCPEKRQATEELLTFLERGVMLDSNSHGIFVQRLCQGRVFWSGPCALRPDQPNKLEREKVEKLFDRKNFEQELEHYQAEGRVAPQYRVTLCFGEEITVTDSAADKLITVQIHQVAAQHLLDREVEIQNASFNLLSENFSDRFTHAFRGVSTSLYGIS